MKRTKNQLDQATERIRRDNETAASKVETATKNRRAQLAPIDLPTQADLRQLRLLHMYGAEVGLRLIVFQFFVHACNCLFICLFVAERCSTFSKQPCLFLVRNKTKIRSGPFFLNLVRSRLPSMLFSIVLPPNCGCQCECVFPARAIADLYTKFYMFDVRSITPAMLDQLDRYVILPSFRPEVTDALTIWWIMWCVSYVLLLNCRSQVVKQFCACAVGLAAWICGVHRHAKAEFEAHDQRQVLKGNADRLAFLEKLRKQCADIIGNDGALLS